MEVANGLAVLAFPPDADFARDSCAGKNRAPLEALLTELAGQPITLKCESRAGLTVEKIAPAETKAEAPPPDPMAAFKDDPLIHKALELFQAEIV